MINVSSRYKEAMSKKLRDRAYISIGIGIVNQNAQENATLNSSVSYWSKGNIFNTNQSNIEYATLEQNFFKTDGSMYFVPENEEIIQLLDNGITTQDEMQYIYIAFDDVYSIKGITLDFTSAYPTKFSIETSEGVFEYENNNRKFETYDVLGDTSFIKITPIEMVGGDKRFRINSVLFGVGLQLSNEQIKECRTTESVSGISEELPSLNLDFSFFDRENMFNVDDDNSFIDFLSAMQNIKVSFGITLENGTIEWIQTAKGYLSDWNIKNGIVSISSTDRLSQMQDDYSKSGNMYERTAYEEAESIFTDAGLQPDEYHIDDYLKDIKLVNPMPEGSHKECLQILANACRCAIRQDENGIIRMYANFATVIDPSDLEISTNGVSDWSNPNKLMIGSYVVYAELTSNFFSVTGDMFFLPENNEYLDVSYVSKEISDENGNFVENPKIEILLPASYSYYGLTMIFCGNEPEEMIIKTYNNENVVFDKTYTNIQKNMYINDEFLSFDKIVFEFTKAKPNNRILLNVITFGKLSDYILTKDDMLSKPVGYKEKKTKAVRCKVYTYEKDESGNITEKEDNVYATKVLSVSGETKTVSNPLISTYEQAELVAEWVANHYSDNTSYSVDYRGEPRINASDIIHMESEILNNLQVEITEHTLKYNGAFSGTLELRRMSKTGEQ